MSGELQSLKPVEGADRPLRQRLSLKDELILAALPTLVVLVVLGLVEVFSRQRLLFASLAASAFLIYLDPLHGMNTVRTLIASHLVATFVGLAMYGVFDHGYVAAGGAMVATIVLMITLDVVHPPAIATSLTFAFREGEERTIVLFILALGLTATLVVLQRTALWTLAHLKAPPGI